MAENNSLSSIGYRAGGFAANHPRLVLMLVMLVLFVAMQGSVAAATDTGGDLLGAQSTGGVNTGP